LVHAQHPGQRSFAADGGVCPGAAELVPKSVLPALAATCCQMLFFGGLRESVVAPEPIAGRGVKGRLLARITLALDLPAPTGWTAQLARGEGAASCAVIHPDQEPCKNRPLCLRCEQRSLDALLPWCLGASILNRRVSCSAAGGWVALAGFYKQDLSFAFASTLKCKAFIRIASQ
jgi:3-hydroxyethyl bacteriochlorophyllide a dehydrogenase